MVFNESVYRQIVQEAMMPIKAICQMGVFQFILLQQRRLFLHLPGLNMLCQTVYLCVFSSPDS